MKKDMKDKNPEKGKRGVAIEFAGKHRLLKYPHGLVGDFEQIAYDSLKKSGLIERDKEGNISVLFADALIPGWLGNAKVFSLALLYGLKHEDAELTIEVVDAGIDSYIEDGGSSQDLWRAIVEAYRLARDPSSVVSLKQNWKTLDEIQKTMQDAAELEGKTRLKGAKDSLKVIQDIISGSKPPDSELKPA